MHIDLIRCQRCADHWERGKRSTERHAITLRLLTIHGKLESSVKITNITKISSEKHKTPSHLNLGLKPDQYLLQRDALTKPRAPAEKHSQSRTVVKNTYRIC